MNNNKPQFLNIDFDIFFSEVPDELIRFFQKSRLSILWADKNHYDETHEFGASIFLVTLEVNVTHQVETLLIEFENMILKLKGKAKAEWEKRDGLVLDFGYNIPKEQRANFIDIPQTILKKACDLQASIRITTYQEDDDQWD